MKFDVIVKSITVYLTLTNSQQVKFCKQYSLEF